MRKKEMNSATKTSAASAKSRAKDFFIHAEDSRTYKDDMVRIFMRN
jgi:hypothetical protein